MKPTASMNSAVRIAVGPWAVVRSLVAALQDGGRTHLSLHGGRPAWVGRGELWKRWMGSEVESRRLAAIHGGVAVPSSYETRRPRAHPQSVEPRRQRHRHDRCGEEIEE